LHFDYEDIKGKDRTIDEITQQLEDLEVSESEFFEDSTTIMMSSKTMPKKSGKKV
jgi:hypothetical protein